MKALPSKIYINDSVLLSYDLLMGDRSSDVSGGVENLFNDFIEIPVRNLFGDLLKTYRNDFLYNLVINLISISRYNYALSLNFSVDNSKLIKLLRSNLTPDSNFEVLEKFFKQLYIFLEAQNIKTLNFDTLFRFLVKFYLIDSLSSLGYESYELNSFSEYCFIDLENTKSLFVFDKSHCYLIYLYVRRILQNIEYKVFIKYFKSIDIYNLDIDNMILDMYKIVILSNNSPSIDIVDFYINQKKLRKSKAFLFSFFNKEELEKYFQNLSTEFFGDKNFYFELDLNTSNQSRFISDFESLLSKRPFGVYVVNINSLNILANNSSLTSFIIDTLVNTKKLYEAIIVINFSDHHEITNTLKDKFKIIDDLKKQNLFDLFVLSDKLLVA